MQKIREPRHKKTCRIIVTEEGRKNEETTTAQICSSINNSYLIRKNTANSQPCVDKCGVTFIASNYINFEMRIKMGFVDFYDGN